MNKKIILVGLFSLSCLTAGGISVGGFELKSGGYNQNTDIEEEHQNSFINQMRSTGGEPYSMSSPTSVSTVDGGDVSSVGNDSVPHSAGASGIEFYATGDVYIHYKKANGGARTKMGIRTDSTSNLSFITENQDSDEPEKTIQFVSSSNGFMEKYTGSNPTVYANLGSRPHKPASATYWYQTAYVSNGKLNIQAGYKVNGTGALQQAISWLSVDLATKTVQSSGIVTSPNGKLRQGITVNASTKEICFVTNLYSIYKYEDRRLVNSYFDKNNVTNCMKYLFR